MSSQNSSIKVSVTKHNGLGNDFLVLDRREASALSNAQVAEIDWPNMARNWCNRKTGWCPNGYVRAAGAWAGRWYYVDRHAGACMRVVGWAGE